MSRPLQIIRENPLTVSLVIVAAGLMLGAVLGGSLGCYLYSHHMSFLHEGARPVCGESPVILWGGIVSGAFIGASCGLLAVILIYIGGRCTRFISLLGAALSVTGFSIYATQQGRGFENYLFTGAFMALGGFALGSFIGLVLDLLKAKGRI